MLHLNKRSCIVTNLIGIQWFTRESIVSRHGMARGITKYWIEGTSVSEECSDEWKRKLEDAIFLFSFSPLAVEMLILLRDLVPSTYQRCACRCKKHVFLCFFLLHGYIYRHSARHRVQFLSRRYHRVLVNCMTSSEITTSMLKAHLQCALYVLLLAFCLLSFYLTVPYLFCLLKIKSWRASEETRNTWLNTIFTQLSVCKDEQAKRQRNRKQRTHQINFNMASASSKMKCLFGFVATYKIGD